MCCLGPFRLEGLVYNLASKHVTVGPTDKLHSCMDPQVRDVRIPIWEFPKIGDPNIVP